MSLDHTKIELDGARINVEAQEATDLILRIFSRLGCTAESASQIANHLVSTSLCGIESHGIVRVLQYAEQVETGYVIADAQPRLIAEKSGPGFVDGGGGFGIPAMALAYSHSMKQASEAGTSTIAIRNVGHTGRHGAYADHAAEQGYLTICFGGGNRQTWRQVAPHGGSRGVLPTNPWCIGVPGGRHGPVVVDFATSKIAGGWVYAAKSAGARLPAQCVIDRHGRPTQDPEDYFDGGAILPAGGHKGYGLGLVGELVAEAVLGPATTELNWLLITIDTEKFRRPSEIQQIAEEILSELRTCPPAEGFDQVEIPGELERRRLADSGGVIAVPEKTWQQILSLADSIPA